MIKKILFGILKLALWPFKALLKLMLFVLFMIVLLYTLLHLLF